ncbi:hypothetical protein TRICI_002088 [Trichomonascus ciferrii]|uniref:Major facilitator superfamily (MFS) profile domain-containing protein n=1 Tax=Trichomonascus ciferrii TaxID=44093 RepID=A0A6A1LVB2_9ASCO|nr:hypothetical protein TRICI_002088 [Trichomonascus ciferrii]
MGGLLFGMETGNIGGIVTMGSFKEDFGLTPENEARIQGTIVSALQAGAFVGVLLTSVVADKFGRRLSLVLCGLVFDIGAIMQTASVGQLGVLYSGRVISGLGVGAASILTPVYISEMAAKEVRGKLLTGFMFATFLGISISYWINYFSQQLLEGTSQWQVPMVLQIMPGLVLTVGTIPLRESPRWLVKKDRRAAALESLVYIRQSDAVMAEFEEICDSADREKTQLSGASMWEVALPKNRHQVMLGVGLMICQQATGTISFTYFAPIFFNQVGLAGESAGLLFTGLYGLIKTFFSMVFMVRYVETTGRRRALEYGGLFMGSIMLAIGFTLWGAGNNGGWPSYLMIALIYLFSVGYSASWGPVPWLYCAEICPTRIREYGVTLSSATQWLANFAVTRVIPLAVKHLGWRLFVLFGLSNYLATLFAWKWVKETKGLSLEEMDKLFHKSDEHQPLLST